MDILNSSNWQSAYYTAMAIFIILDIGMVAGIIFAFMKLFDITPDFNIAKRGKSVITIKKTIYQEQWNSILKKASLGSPDSFRVAIIEADALVDRLLKQIGFKGDTIGDRLQKLDANELASIDRIWRAHKVRNHLVHTTGYRISSNEAKTVLDDYEAFFKELGVL